MKPKIIISACLLGENVKYNGQNNLIRSPLLEQWMEEGLLVPLCPEVLGGLSVPRSVCEMVQGTHTVISKESKDVTAAFDRGAHEALKMAQSEGVVMAILKARSSSCGTGLIYDGTFSGVLIEGSGITSAVLQESGIAVFHEDELLQAHQFWMNALECL